MPDNFKMVIANIYSLQWGVAVTGRIETGTVKIGDELTISGAQGRVSVKVLGIERFKEGLESANADSGLVGITLTGIDHDRIRNQDLLIDS